MGTPRFFRKVFTGDRGMDTLQTNIEQAVTPAIKSQLLDGRLITAQNLVSGDNKVQHKLGRVPQGYIIVKRTSGATVYDTSETDSNFLILNSSGTLTVSIWVF
jgi:Tfp pilus assembly protein FimT